MKKSMLGDRIHSLRKEKSVTQEELGRSLGVTAQAVSNWECGGTPDAELLPAIADFFGVSVDYLFGKSDEIKKDILLELIWELSHTPKEERFEKAYQYCWSIQQGLFNLDPGLLTGALREDMVVPDSTKITSVLLFEEGMTYMRVNDNMHSFFLLPTPQGGIGSKLLEAWEYEKFFSILGKKDRMRALLFLYGRKPMALSGKRMADYLLITEKEAEDILRDLCELQLLQEFEMDTEEGSCILYRAVEYYPNIAALVPFLFSAGDLIKKAECCFNNAVTKNQPIL